MEQKHDYEVRVATGKVFNCNVKRALYYAEANEEKDDVDLEVFEIDAKGKAKKIDVKTLKKRVAEFEKNEA